MIIKIRRMGKALDNDERNKFYLVTAQKEGDEIADKYTIDQLKKLKNMIDKALEPAWMRARPKGLCRDCNFAKQVKVHTSTGISKQYRERGYVQPCLSCGRPGMTNFEPRASKKAKGESWPINSE